MKSLIPALVKVIIAEANVSAVVAKSASFIAFKPSMKTDASVIKSERYPPIVGRTSITPSANPPMILPTNAPIASPILENRSTPSSITLAAPPLVNSLSAPKSPTIIPTPAVNFDNATRPASIPTPAIAPIVPSIPTATENDNNNTDNAVAFCKAPSTLRADIIVRIEAKPVTTNNRGNICLDTVVDIRPAAPKIAKLPENEVNTIDNAVAEANALSGSANDSNNIKPAKPTAIPNIMPIDFLTVGNTLVVFPNISKVAPNDIINNANAAEFDITDLGSNNDNRAIIPANAAITLATTIIVFCRFIMFLAYSVARIITEKHNINAEIAAVPIITFSGLSKLSIAIAPTNISIAVAIFVNTTAALSAYCPAYFVALIITVNIISKPRTVRSPLVISIADTPASNRIATTNMPIAIDIFNSTAPVPAALPSKSLDILINDLNSNDDKAITAIPLTISPVGMPARSFIVNAMIPIVKDIFIRPL